MDKVVTLMRELVGVLKSTNDKFDKLIELLTPRAESRDPESSPPRRKGRARPTDKP